MLILTKHPEKWKHLDPMYHEVVDHFFQTPNAEILASDIPLAISFRDTYGTQSGPCLVLGMGSSRELIRGKRVRYPVFAVNRAILEYPEAEFWCVQDKELLPEIAPQVKTDPVLVVYGPHARTKEWSHALRFRKILVEIFPDPRRHLKRPLYWNQTTVAWTWDLALRMGFDKIYSLGVDLSEAAYKHPLYSPEFLAHQHQGVRDRMMELFSPADLGAWNAENKPVIDLAPNSYLPVPKDSVEAILCR